MVAVGVLSGTMAACGSSWDLPDRSRPQVRDVEHRNAPTVARALGHDGCDLRDLGPSGGRLHFWAECESEDAGSVSLPVVVVAASHEVRWPEDGAGYTASIHELFPEGLADRILDNDPVLRPRGGR